ncbi:hypothetical protein ACFX2B_010523 [Malus domestica]
MAASRQYKALNSKSDVSGDEKSLYVSLSLDNSFESDVMKHNRALLLLSSDFGTAWHSRKLVVSQKHKLSAFLDKQHDYKDFVVDGIQTEPFNLINEEREEVKEITKEQRGGGVKYKLVESETKGHTLLIPQIFCHEAKCGDSLRQLTPFQ